MITGIQALDAAKPQRKPIMERIPPKLASALRIIGNILKEVFKALAAIALYVVAPNIFVAGFLIGVVWQKKTSEAIHKVGLVWSKQTWKMGLIFGVASALALPVTLAATSFLWAAHYGSRLSKSAQQIVKQQQNG